MKTKILSLSLAAILACFSSGCSTTGGVTAPDPQVAQLVGQTIITTLVPAVLNRNPAYEVALVAIVDGVDLVFAKGTLSPEDVNAYLDLVAGRTALDPDTRLLIGSAVLDLYGIYAKTAGVKVASTADPKFVALLNSFKDSVREGIRRYHVFKPAAAH